MFVSEGAFIGIKVSLKRVCSKTLTATVISKRALARTRKEGRDIEKGVTVSF
jgi:hypothetical protein